MSRRTRIFVGIFVVYLAAVGFLLYRVAADLDPRYRESAEESLVDTANLLATLLERSAYNGIILTEELERTLAHLRRRPIYARIFDIEKTQVDLHVYVTDRNGIVLFDSRGRDVGADYLAWRDVQLTLEGTYGARTTLVDPRDPRSAVMYVGAAIREQRADLNAAAGDDIVGMVAVGKPISAFSPFIVNARNKLLLFGAIAVVAFALLLLLATLWLVRPFGFISDLWYAATRGPRGSVPQVLRGVGHAARTALANMRDAVAGRSYADEYVTTLTHELKSPLAAIRGAAELLREPLPDDARTRFIGNIEEQTQRAQDLIDRLLELSSLERRGALQTRERVAIDAIVQAVAAELAPVAQRKGVALECAPVPDFVVDGEGFLLQRALANLVRNAIEFAPRGSTVSVSAAATAREVSLEVRDRGPGLPPYARARLFEKFFSLPRPDTGRKSTGLGLAFVREVAQLHGGDARLENHAGGGALATLALPLAGAR
jgi:two-component system sensor histidine kinase CreC